MQTKSVETTYFNDAGEHHSCSLPPLPSNLIREYMPSIRMTIITFSRCEQPDYQQTSCRKKIQTQHDATKVVTFNAGYTLLTTMAMTVDVVVNNGRELCLRTNT